MQTHVAAQSVAYTIRAERKIVGLVFLTPCILLLSLSSIRFQACCDFQRHTHMQLLTLIFSGMILGQVRVPRIFHRVALAPLDIWRR